MVGEFVRVDRKEREVKKAGDEVRGKGDAVRDVGELRFRERGEDTRERKERGGESTGDGVLQLDSRVRG